MGLDMIFIDAKSTLMPATVDVNRLAAFGRHLKADSIGELTAVKSTVNDLHSEKRTCYGNDQVNISSYKAIHHFHNWLEGIQELLSRLTSNNDYDNGDDMPGGNSVLSKVKADGNGHEESSYGGTPSNGFATKKARASAASKVFKKASN
ncbi:hypothetical protein Bca52824_026453 [Brassica carinata]|uniref:Uncharacterized protein n=1 Tax=Brassica carinata TaxID=52824 RepID=A0A8X7V7X8_BRACI|nr:hypothetical protein Bca52824_026453 [Brassica carinata]